MIWPCATNGFHLNTNGKCSLDEMAEIRYNKQVATSSLLREVRRSALRRVRWYVNERSSCWCSPRTTGAWSFRSIWRNVWTAPSLICRSFSNEPAFIGAKHWTNVFSQSSKSLPNLLLWSGNCKFMRIHWIETEGRRYPRPKNTFTLQIVN